MRQEWLRAGVSTPACWACFAIFHDHVKVLAVIGVIDGSMTPDAARKVWADLQQRGWCRVTEADLSRNQMSHHALRRMAYGRR